MRTCALNIFETGRYSRSHASLGQTTRHRLGLVNPHEIEDLRHKLARGQIPPDLELKLKKLSQGPLAHRSIDQNCRTIIELLLAGCHGVFNGASAEERERLLRVLAYVRKDDDAIPDYRQDGFADDLQEVQAVARDLGSVLQNFKLWRLRHQVPIMWHAAQELMRATPTAVRPGKATLPMISAVG
jgi:hypothetical protein